jgi:hypothetical protein
MVLFSILFQSIHSYEHIATQFSEKKCHHSYNDANGEITHQHYNDDTCYVCHFSFGSYLVLNEVAFKFQNLNKEIPYFFTPAQKVYSLSENAYLLRGPPTDLVS